MRRLSRIPVFAPNTLSTVRTASIVLPPRQIRDPISEGSTRSERRVPSSSCFSEISIAAVLMTIADTMNWRYCIAVMRKNITKNPRKFEGERLFFCDDLRKGIRVLSTIFDISCRFFHIHDESLGMWIV